MFEFLLLSKIPPSQLGYYFICKRKLWLVANGIEQEQHSSIVQLAKLAEATVNLRKTKNLKLFNAVIDWVELRNNTIHEYKASDKYSEASRFQCNYYLLLFNRMGCPVDTAVIHYKATNKTETLLLANVVESEIFKIIEAAEQLVLQETPPGIPKGAPCKHCAFFDFCYS